MKPLSGFLSFLFLVVLICFAVSNRNPVLIKLWPFDFTGSAPLSLFIIGAFILGWGGGAIRGWFSAAKHRHKSRGLQRDLASMQKDLGGAEQKKNHLPSLSQTQISKINSRLWKNWKRP